MRMLKTRKWVPLQCLSRSEPLTSMTEHLSNMWAAFQCLSKSETLTRSSEYTSSRQVTLQCFSRSDPLIKWLILHLNGIFLSLLTSQYSHWLIFLQSNDLAVFLNPYFQPKESGPSYYFNLKWKFPDSSLIFFAGLLNTSFPLWLFIYLIHILMPTALLICMENTFWNNIRDSNFVELFKKSFTLYIESGMRKKTEAEIDVLGYDQGRVPETEDFEAKFHNFIIGHYLCKIYFYFH